MLKIALFVVILAHGIGHILFLIQVLGIADWGQSSQSWLLSSASLAKVVGGVLWLVAIVAFSAAGIGMIAQQDWWRMVAVIAAVVSLLGLIVFWSTPASSSAYFAGVVDLAVVLALLVARWPSVELLGA